MPINRIEYKVFLSSPSNLSDERKILKEIIEKIVVKDISFKCVLWEEDLPSMRTNDVQSEINERLLKDSDIILGFFKERFGNRTERYPSGTVEEIEEAIIMDKPVILYFLNYELTGRHTSNNDVLKDLIRINEFKNKYKSRGVFHDCKDISEVEKRLTEDLLANVEKISQNPQSSFKNDDNLSAFSTSQHSENSEKDDEWFKYSISEKINTYLAKKALNYSYIDDLTFHENLLRAVNSQTPYMQSSVKRIMEEAREYAFNEKYGNYNYSYDLRSVYPNWYDGVSSIIKKYYNKSYSISLLDVGSNCGDEIFQIMKGLNNFISLKNVFALDISDVAIENGKKRYGQKINFFQSDMEDTFPFSEMFDVCLCLRAIQSRGVFRQDALIQMASHIKKGGLLIISIPNGYVDINKTITRGLYDHRTKTFLRDRPMQLCNKIVHKLQDYGFEEINFATDTTEILIYARKGD